MGLHSHINSNSKDFVFNDTRCSRTGALTYCNEETWLMYSSCNSCLIESAVQQVSCTCIHYTWWRHCLYGAEVWFQCHHVSWWFLVMVCGQYLHDPDDDLISQLGLSNLHIHSLWGTLKLSVTPTEHPVNCDFSFFKVYTSPESSWEARESEDQTFRHLESCRVSPKAKPWQTCTEQTSPYTHTHTHSNHDVLVHQKCTQRKG